MSISVAAHVIESCSEELNGMMAIFYPPAALLIGRNQGKTLIITDFLPLLSGLQLCTKSMVEAQEHCINSAIYSRFLAIRDWSHLRNDDLRRHKQAACGKG